MGDTHLSDAEAFTLHLERDPIFRSTIVAVVQLDRSPRWDRLTETIDRASRLEPNFRRRISPAVGPLVPARWVEDPDFDLTWHLRRIAVPSPGTFDAVLEFARIAGMTAFDPVRPRWEFTLVEGLDGGRAALVMKVHHALTDGIGGIQIARHVVDLDRRGTRRAPIPEPWSPADHVAERAVDAVTHDVARVAGLLGGAARALPGAVASWARRPLGTWSEVARNAGSVARFVRPLTSTLSPVMTERRLGWRYHALDVPLTGLKAAAAMADGTLNDAFLAGIAGGMARYHRDRGTTVEELMVTMPISVRRPDDPPGGNRITLVRLPLPIGDHHPISRMIAIDRSTARWRAEPAVAWNESIAGALNLLPTAVTAGLLRHVDLLASNVPGFDAPVYVAGSRVESFHAFGPTLGTAVNVTLMSYREICHLGVTTDTGAVDDADHLVRCLDDSFTDLTNLARARVDR